MFLYNSLVLALLAGVGGAEAYVHPGNLQLPSRRASPSVVIVHHLSSRRTRLPTTAMARGQTYQSSQPSYSRSASVKHSMGTKPLRQMFCLRRVITALTAFICSCFGTRVWAAASSSSRAASSFGSSATSSTYVVGWPQLGAAFGLVFYTSFLALQLQSPSLKPLGLSIIKACGRCALQLYLSGAIILTPLLASTTQPWIVGAWLLFTGVVASREAAARVDYVYPGMARQLFVALNASLAVVLAASLGLHIVAPKPWYNPRTWVPIAGMLMGNAVTATALAAGTLTRELVTKRGPLELQLARGATWKEALNPVIRTVYNSALTPTINALSVTGIVHIPGLMTGQLLASSTMTPLQAAMYQILIFFLIASTSCTSVQAFTQSTLRSLVDPKLDRLRLVDERSGRVLLQSKASFDKEKKLSRYSILSNLSIRTSWRRLWKKVKRTSRFNGGSRGFSLEEMDTKETSSKHWDEIERGMLHGKPIGGAVNVISGGPNKKEKQSNKKVYAGRIPTTVRYRKFENSQKENSSSLSETEIVLKVDNMRIDRTAVSISVEMRPNDLIGIQGPSGVGKSQLLRTLAGLELLDRSTVSLFGRTAEEMEMSHWRKEVALVPQQQAPMMEGTPRAFITRVLSFHSQQAVASGGQSKGIVELSSLLSQWNLPAGILDRQWSTLSGGEAQRVGLAIAIALEPTVLLLDEPTSALDMETTLLVEKTLISLPIPILMVSHDKQQIFRLCNQVIDFVPVGPLSMRGLK